MRIRLLSLPKVDDTQAKLSDIKVWQTKCKQRILPNTFDQKIKTTHNIYYILWTVVFNNLPFEIISSALNYFQKMSQILSGLSEILCLMDDVIVFQKDTKIERCYAQTEFEALNLATTCQMKEFRLGMCLQHSKIWFSNINTAFRHFYVTTTQGCPYCHSTLTLFLLSSLYLEIF